MHFEETFRQNLSSIVYTESIYIQFGRHIDRQYRGRNIQQVVFIVAEINISASTLCLTSLHTHTHLKDSKRTA